MSKAFDNSQLVNGNTTLREAVKKVDGSGSGLDADTVDGLHASHFLTVLNAPEDVVVFDSVGTYTYTPSQDTKRIFVFVLGGGGSGAFSTNGTGGGGGGAGGCVFAVIDNPVGSYTCVVGAGGAVPAAGAHGNPGLSSSFSNGNITITADGGDFGSTSADYRYYFGGAGGAGSVSGTVKFYRIIPGEAGLGGAGSSGNGPAGAAGGSNFLFKNQYRVVHYPSSSPTNFGCGGNGNLGGSSFSPRAGGNGYIEIWEYK